MDGSRFDEIARRLGTPATRRSRLRAVVFGVLAAAAPAKADGKGKGEPGRGGPGTAGPCGNNPKKNLCKKNADCCTGYCDVKGGGEGRCRCAPKGEQCTNKTACCNGLSCQNGRCRPDAVACDVCASGCPFSDLDAALAAAQDGAVIDVDAGDWATSHAGGGIIADGRTITVRACNGVAGVRVTSNDWTTFQVGDPGTGHWILEGLDIGNDEPNGTGNIVYLAGIDDDQSASLVARDCRILSGGASGFGVSTYGVSANSWSDVEMTDCEISGQSMHGFSSTGADSGPGARPNVADLTRVTVSGVTGWSGMLFSAVDAVLADCSVTGNTSITPGRAGGITIEGDGGATVQLAGTTTVSGNTSSLPNNAGGIISRTTQGAQSVSLTIGSQASVTNNSGMAAGGHAYFGLAGAFTLTGGAQITGNAGTQCSRFDVGTQSYTPVANCAY